MQLEALRLRARQAWDFSDAVAERLNALVYLTAWRLQVAARGARMPKENDGADNMLMAHLAEGAVILTDDGDLIACVDACGTYQAPWVRRLEELDLQMPDGPPWGPNARDEAERFERSR